MRPGRPGEDGLEPFDAVLRGWGGTGWLRFSGARRTWLCRRMEEVLPALAEVSRAVESGEGHAAGFVSYDAAPAFDGALRTRGDPGFPLLGFGLFPAPEALARLPPPPQGTRLPASWVPSIRRRDHARCLARIRRHIRDGDTYQANFTLRLRAPLAGDPWQLFLGMAQEPAPPGAGFITAGRWSILCASPELFFSLDGDRIESRPMKGTAPRGRWCEEDRDSARALLRSAKDRAENVMILDMVRNDVGRVARYGSVRVHAPYLVERFPTVWQMTSTVLGRTERPLEEVFRALFPPATITGAPKARTMQILSELEDSPRRIYTGALGWIAPGRRARFSVAIRTVLLDREARKAEYGVGGGIVWDSRAEKEWDECAVKARALAPRWPDFDLLETLLWTPRRGYALLDAHLRRMRDSAAYFGIGADPDALRKELERAASRLSPVPHRVRLTVGRDGESRVDAAPLGPRTALPGLLPLAPVRVDPAQIFLYHKTTHREIYGKALESVPGARDVLLVNLRGEVTESTIANVVVRRPGGALVTPPVRCGLLPGTYRAMLLARGAVREEVVTLDGLLAAPQAFLANSVRGMWAVAVDPAPRS